MKFKNSLTPHFPRADLPRWQQVVTAPWLHAMHCGEAVEARPAGAWCVVEVGCGAPEAFAQAHIPQARYLDTHRLEQEPLWTRVSDAAFAQVLGSLGIGRDTAVILYGRSMVCAGRAAHLMLYAGVQDVRLLDGGFAAWQRAGLPLAQGMSTALSSCESAYFALSIQAHLIIDTPQAQALLQQPDGALVSIRTWQEHIGETSGYRYIEAKGDISGALWGHAGDEGDVHSMSAFYDADGLMRSAAEITALWAEAGITPDKNVAFYCGTGWRASLAFFYAWLMGWERIVVYDGGWLAWSSQASPATLPL